MRRGTPEENSKIRWSASSEKMGFGCPASASCFSMYCLVASCYKPASQRKVAPDWRCPVKVIALVLFAALEDLAQQRIGALGGWNAQSLVRRMHIMQLRPE